MNEHTDKFNKRIDTPEPHIVAMLGMIDGIRGEFKSGLRMTPQAITSLKKSVLITSTGASTRIEGSKLSDDDVQKILNALSVSKFSDRDSQEVQGYLETLQNVFNGYQTLPLREGVIISLHNELLKYSDKDALHKGNYKKQENLVGITNEKGEVTQVLFETTPAWLVQKEMTEIVEYSFDALEQSHFHPLLVIAHFLVEFLKIHPFQDGNGRMSRILTNMLLLRAGYQFVQYVSHEQIIEERKDAYYYALQASQKSFKTENDTIAPWLNFFLSVVKEQATRALIYLEEEKFEDMLSPKQLVVWKYLVVKSEASPAQIAKDTGIIIATVRQALLRLVALEKIKRVGSGPQIMYVVVK
jgi:Fic family protein